MPIYTKNDLRLRGACYRCAGKCTHEKEHEASEFFKGMSSILCSVYGEVLHKYGEIREIIDRITYDYPDIGKKMQEMNDEHIMPDEIFRYAINRAYKEEIINEEEYGMLLISLHSF